MTLGLEGGCLCGAIRYRLETAPFDCGYCHCRTCQQASGAPVLVFATVLLDGFRILRGEPRRFQSSAFGEGWFCADCGTSMCIHVDFQPDTIDFTVASLDQPERVAPGFHIWENANIEWFRTSDDLPRFDHFRPNTRGLDEEPAAKDTPTSRASIYEL